jgi:hypothetical protein
MGYRIIPTTVAAATTQRRTFHAEALRFGDIPDNANRFALRVIVGS